jgi:AAA domain
MELARLHGESVPLKVPICFGFSQRGPARTTCPLPQCYVSKLCDGVTTKRSLQALTGPESSPILSRFIQGSSADEQTIAAMSHRSEHSVTFLACQFMFVLRQINLAQFSFIYETLKCLAFSSTQRAVPKVILQGPPGTGKTKTIAQLLSLLYHEIPLHSANKRRAKAREPRLRTLICAASNAGVDEVLRKLVSQGVMTLNFESITGVEVDIGSPTYFDRAISKILPKNLRKEVDVQSLFKKQK